MMSKTLFSRRRILSVLKGMPLTAVPFIARSPAKASSTVAITHGFSVGEVTQRSAILWARLNGAGRMRVDLSRDEKFREFRSFLSDKAPQKRDFNIKVSLTGLEPAQRYFIRCGVIESKRNNLEFDDFSGEILSGEFTSATESEEHNLRFLWSGDTCGQGYGIDTQQGGFLSYSSMSARKPDFFIHCGDQIYADNPIEATRTAEGGLVWKNWLEKGKLKVAETAQEFRENFYYNFADVHLSKFHRQVPVYHMWDDHEVVNNWYPDEILQDDARYTEKNVNVLAANAQRAFVDCLPVDDATFKNKPLYRYISRGPLLDLFFVDLRTYRGKNSENEQTVRSEETAIFGDDQLSWLKRSLLDAKGLWKIVCIDMPISVLVKEWGANISENAANSDGAPKGRELEYADLLGFIKKQDIRNVHFITADVHYCASYHCSPERAQFKRFKPFWEFVSGPLHAGTFGPNPMDNTFGPKAEFIGLPDSFEPGSSPATGLQFFGEINIDAASRTMSVAHHNRIGQKLWQIQLDPE